MEGKDRPALRCLYHLPAFLLDDVKPHPAVGLPLVIPNERLAAELEPQRVDHERELREYKIPFAHSKRVYVRGSLSAKSGDDRLSSGPLIDAEEVVVARPAEFQKICVVTAADVINMRVSTGTLTLDALVITVPAERVQRVRVEPDRHSRFSVGYDFAGQFVDTDIAVVSELRGKPGRYTLEEGSAWVGRELAPADPARSRRLKERLAAQIAVGVCHAAAGKGELVQHREPVEPMVVALLTSLELRWSGPYQGAGEPERQGASDGQVIEAGFP